MIARPHMSSGETIMELQLSPTTSTSSAFDALRQTGKTLADELCPRGTHWSDSFSYLSCGFPMGISS